MGLVGFECASDLALAGFRLGGGREGAVASTAFDFFPASFDSSPPLFAGQGSGAIGLFPLNLLGESLGFGSASTLFYGVSPLGSVELGRHGNVYRIVGDGGESGKEESEGKVFPSGLLRGALPILRGHPAPGRKGE